MKYINLKYAGMIIFDKSQNHRDMAERFPNDEVISAGFVNAWALNDELQVQAHGESITLKVSSSKYDGNIIKRMLGLYA